MRQFKILIKIITLLMITSSTLAHAGAGKDLRIAAKEGDVETVKSLLEEGVNVDAINKKGSSALIAAAKHGNTNIVQLLLSHGASLNLRNWYDNSAIDVADNNSYDEISEIMTDGCKEQFVNFSLGEMKPAKFVKLMKHAFLNRRYNIDNSDANSVTATYGRSERLYKIKGSIDGDKIMLQFIRGYGARNPNYLRNLKKDLSILSLY